MVKRLISLITLCSVVFTMTISGTTRTVQAETEKSQLTDEELVEAFKSDIKKYQEKVNTNSATNEDYSENKDNAYDPEEEIKVIVELEEAPVIDDDNDTSNYSDSDKEKEEDIKDDQNIVIEKVQEITGTSVDKKFSYLVNGFSINAKRKDIDVIKYINGVKTVEEAQTYKRDMSAAIEITQAASEWKDYGYTGQGMVISIIDSGIDYTHKDLQNIDKSNIKLKESDINEKINSLGYGQYFSDKIPYGYNYADNNTDIIDTSANNMHGMHVAGIAAANGSEDELSTYKSIKGVAPQAQLLAMKVFTNNTSMEQCLDDDIFQAIEDSVKLGADIINLSLGSNSGFNNADSACSRIMKKATEAGVICVVSAGNNSTSTQISSFDEPNNLLGIKDNGTVSSLSAVPSSFSVASMENLNILKNTFKYATDSNNSGKIQYSYSCKESYLENLLYSFEIVDCSFGSEDEIKDDLTGKIALIERGERSFQDKYDNATYKNAAAVIIYNNEDGGNNPIDSMIINGVDRPVVSIGYSDGEKIKTLVSSGDNKFTFSEFEKESAQNENGGKMSAFTSWGPTSDLQFKPEITAPGGRIYSLANDNSYQYMDGTSMATPNVAGSEALILQSVKEKNLNISGSELVTFIKGTVMNTAKPIIYNNESYIPYSPRRQGAGLMQVEDAIKNNVIITSNDGSAAAALKEIGKTTQFTLLLTNYGNKDVTYTLKNENVYGEGVDDKKVIQEVKLDGSSAVFDKNEVTVKANSTATVNVTLNISDNEQIDRFVEGYLNFVSVDSSVPSLNVPFMGFYGDWSKENIIDTPNYENSGSIVGISGLGPDDKSLYGTYIIDGQKYIDKNKVAFSPNNDKCNDEVIPLLYFLRNAKKVEISVLDSSGNEVKKLYDSYDIGKNLIEYGTKPNSFTKLPWDGTVYDKSTGESTTTSDGQYTIRVKSKVDLSDAKEQIIDMPIKVDTKAPEVSIMGVEKYTDGDGSNHFKLSWKASDEESGSDIMPIYKIAVNGQIIDIDSSSVIAINGVYSAEIPSFIDDEVNDIKLTVSDYAGNVSVASSKEKAGNLQSIKLSNLSDGMIIGPKDLTDGKYVIKATIGNDCGIIKINGQEKTSLVNNNYLECPIDITEGEQIVKVYAEDKDGNIEHDYGYKIILDTVSPEVTVTENISSEKPYYVTENDNLALNFSVRDDTNCTAYIHNKSNSNDSESEVILDETNSGTANVKLLNGLNKIILKICDKAGNSTIKDLIVMKGDKTAKLNVTMDNLLPVQYFNKDSVTADGVYTISGYVNKNTGNIKINGEDITINDDLTFKCDVKLVEGRNNIKLYAEDTDGTIVSNYSYRIYYDETAPKIDFINMPVLREDGKAYTNSTNFNLSGTVKDYLYSCVLEINDDVVQYNKDFVTKKEFSKDIKLSNGDNIITINLEDENGNTIVEKLTVVLDKEAPSSKPNIEISTENLTNKPVSVKLSSDESKLDRIEYSTDGINYVKYTGEFIVGSSATIYARAVDYAGNVSEISTKDIKIDTINPTIDTKVSTTDITKGNVTVTVNSDDENFDYILLPDGRKVTEKTSSFEISQNGEYTFKAYDKAGNEVSKVVTVSNIDKDIPNINVATLSTDKLTNSSVVITIDSKEADIKSITLPDGKVVAGNKTDYTVDKNGQYVFTFTDNAGNIASKTVIVSNIDKTNPIIDTKVSTTDITKGNVTVTVNSDDENFDYILIPDGKKLTEKTASFEISQNGEYTFKAYDKAGNEVSKVVKISNIDKTSPTIETKVSEFDEKNKIVTVTVNSDDENFDYILLPDGTKKTEKTASFIINKNGDYTFKAYDKAGNEISKVVTVSGIKDGTDPGIPPESGDNNINILLLLFISVIGAYGMRKAKKIN